MTSPVDLPTYDDFFHWGAEIIDIEGRDLPALKASFLIESLPQTGRLLEIGCGGGRILATVAHHRPDLELHGCDIRPVTADPFFEFRLVDPTTPELPYDPGSFDAVIAFDVLEHVLDPASTLAAAADVLTPDGMLVSFTPLEGQRLSFHRLYRKLLGDDLYVDTKEHLHAFSEADLVGLVSQRFSVIRRRYAYHLLGQLMDATLYAATRIPIVRERFWSDNPNYSEGGADDAGSSLVGRVLKAANLLAFAESRVLAERRITSAGLLFVARPR